MAFLDNVTWPKVCLVLGIIIVPIAAYVLFPEAARWFAALFEDTVHHITDAVGGKS